MCSTSLAVAMQLNALHDPHTGRTDEVALLSVLSDIAAGLEYLHRSNIVHGGERRGTHTYTHTRARVRSGN